MSDEGARFGTADDARRCNAELDADLLALAGDIRPDELHVDPRNGEWTLAQNLGHIAEFPRFFGPQIVAQMRGEHPRVGRTHEHEDRLRAVDAARASDLEQLRSGLESSLAELALVLDELTDADLDRVAENGKYGDEPLRVFLDRYVIGHKAAHVQQLRATIDTVRALDA